LFIFFGFREGSQLSANERFLIRKYQECDDGFEFVVKSMDVSVSIDIADLENRTENLMNLRYPCISYTIGVVLRSPSQELLIFRNYSSRGSVSGVISTLPEWWTLTAKVKSIVRVVLSM
jgi:hypothetical protein